MRARWLILARFVIVATFAIVLGSLAPRHGIAAQESAAAEPQKSLDEAAVLGPPAGPPLSGVELDRRTRELGERMRCPVCQGLSITASPSASALAMVAQVRDLLARGYSEQQVLDYFVRSYGEFVLLEPKAEGFNLVVWLLPVAGVLIGAALIATRLRQSRRRGVGAHGSSDASAESKAGESGDAAPRRRDDDLDPELARYVERVRSEVGS
jgi:cytochrome c-type biogenesis protein CcmH